MSRAIKVLAIAMVCHAANKAWCEANGDNSQKSWDEAAEWQRQSAINGVEFRLANPAAGKDAQHNAWMAEKLDQGWKYGELKDASAMTHPCLVPFDQLPLHQQQKDAMFCAVVDSLVTPDLIEVPVLERAYTFGQKAVGLSFNPSGDDKVGTAKQTIADAIDQMNDFRNDFSTSQGAKRHASCAITMLEDAQMRMVKALTWRD